MKKNYKILGLEEGSTLEEVEKKYNKLLKEFDPKKQSKDLQGFFKTEQDKVKEAYKEISLSFTNKEDEVEEVILKEIDEIEREIEDISKYYTLLGITEDSSIEEIDQKYNQLLNELNPNNQSDSLRDFFEAEQEKIREAYDKIIKHNSENNESANEISDEVHELGVFQGSEETKFCKFCGHMQYVTNSECVNCRESLFPINNRNVVRSNRNIIKSNNSKRRMFSSVFLFNGRIRRLEYGLSCIIFAVYFSIIINHHHYVYSSYRSYSYFELRDFVILIPFLWFFIAQGWKRSHDLGRSGWMQLIPFYNPFILIFSDGEIGDNEYGSNPKGLN